MKNMKLQPIGMGKIVSKWCQIVSKWYKTNQIYILPAGQPPTPSTTPGLQAAFGFQAAQAAVGAGGGVGGIGGPAGLGIIPEHLAESIHRSLRVRDEGLDSTSSPGENKITSKNKLRFYQT